MKLFAMSMFFLALSLEAQAQRAFPITVQVPVRVANLPAVVESASVECGCHADKTGSGSSIGSGSTSIPLNATRSYTGTLTVVLNPANPGTTMAGSYYCFLRFLGKKQGVAVILNYSDIPTSQAVTQVSGML